MLVPVQTTVFLAVVRQPPSGVAYQPAIVSYRQGQAILATVPVTSAAGGQPTLFLITPALPAGQWRPRLVPPTHEPVLIAPVPLLCVPLCVPVWRYVPLCSPSVPFCVPLCPPLPPSVRI